MKSIELTVQIPEDILYTLNETKKDFTRKMKLYAAGELYKLGKLSMGKAAELAGMNKVDFLFDFEKLLRKTRADGRTALLIVDEAQRLNDNLLDQIRVLSNIERQDRIEARLNGLGTGPTGFRAGFRGRDRRRLDDGGGRLVERIDRGRGQRTDHLVGEFLLGGFDDHAPLFAPDVHDACKRILAARLLFLVAEHIADILFMCPEIIALQGDDPLDEAVRDLLARWTNGRISVHRTFSPGQQ